MSCDTLEPDWTDVEGPAPGLTTNVPSQHNGNQDIVNHTADPNKAHFLPTNEKAITNH